MQHSNPVGIRHLLPERRAEIAARFRKYYAKAGANGCWEWRGGKRGGGAARYGGFQLNGKNLPAHRVAYELYVAEIPVNLFVLHRCDNPPCVNPAHLFLGTPKDNVDDMIAKGRDHREMGSDRYNAKLTEDKVREMKARMGSEGDQALSRVFGVSRMAVYLIRNKRRWKHV